MSVCLFVCLSVCQLHYENKHNKSILPNLALYRQILAQLLPTTFTMLVMFTAGFIVQFYLKTFGTPAVAAYLGSFEGEDVDSLMRSYLLAKARFRHFTGRAPRRPRFPHSSNPTEATASRARRS